MNLKPLDDKVLVEVLPLPETVKGVYLPESAKNETRKAKVIAVGPGKVLPNGELSKMEVKEGDTIIFAQFAGNDVKIDGKEYKILQHKDIDLVII